MLVADDSKKSTFLGQKWTKGVPIEVSSFAFQMVKHKIETNLGGTAVLRMASKKAGPVVTDNGNFILDWQFNPAPERTTEQWKEINTTLCLIPGVLETGLFVDMAISAFVGSSDGTSEVISKK